MQHTSHAIHFSTIRQYWHIYFTVKFLRFYLPHDQETSCLICHWEIDGRSTLSAFICICFRVVSHTQLAIYDITTWSLLHGVPFHHYYYGMWWAIKRRPQGHAEHFSCKTLQHDLWVLAHMFNCEAFEVLPAAWSRNIMSNMSLGLGDTDRRRSLNMCLSSLPRNLDQIHNPILWAAHLSSAYEAPDICDC